MTQLVKSFKDKLDEILSTKLKYLQLGKGDNFDYITNPEFDILIDFLSNFPPKEISFVDVVFVSELRRYVERKVSARVSRNFETLLKACLKSSSLEFIRCTDLDANGDSDFMQIICTPSNVTNLRFVRCNIELVQKQKMDEFLKDNYKIMDVEIVNDGKVEMYSNSSSAFGCIVAVHGQIKSHLLRNRSYEACCLSALQLILIHKHHQSILNIVDKNIILIIAKMVYKDRCSYEWIMNECTKTVHEFWHL